MTDWLIILACIIVSIACAIAIGSLIRFKNVLIKLIIIEVLTNLLVGSIGLWALIYKQPIYIDICLPLALVLFLGTVAFYQFLLEREKHHVAFDQ